MAIREYNLSIDQFKEPLVSKDADAIRVLLVRLLLLEPGTIQSHPDMGVGIASRYRYDEDKSFDLQRDFKTQIDKWLPYFSDVNITVQQRNHTYYITAEISKYGYSFNYDLSTKKLSSEYASLSDL